MLSLQVQGDNSGSNLPLNFPASHSFSLGGRFSRASGAKWVAWELGLALAALSHGKAVLWGTYCSALLAVLCVMPVLKLGTDSVHLGGC